MSKELNFFETEIERKSPERQRVKKESPDSINKNSESLSESFSPSSPELEAEDFTQINEQLKSHLKRVVEALLFASPDPLPLAKIREVTDTILPLRPRQLRAILDELTQDYLSQQRAFKIDEIAQGYVLRTYEEYAPYLDLLYKNKRWDKLSPASTEVLAIIAYRQPITRPQIDAIRGVDSSGSLAQLIERQLVESMGKLEAPGRPTLYGTTKEFLKHFGLKDLSELQEKTRDKAREKTSDKTLS